MDILGIKVDFISKEMVIEKILSVIQEKKLEAPFFIVTANGEFVLQAQNNLEFANALKKADLILPDGVSILQARDYIEGLKIINSAYLALKIFITTLKGKYKNQVITGVDIVRHFLNLPKNSKNPKIFLLGGYHGAARLLAEKYHCDFHPGVTEIKKITTDQNKEIFSVIKKANPDILFVSFGHFEQEKWIAKNLENLSCKAVLGVGSSFDELARIGSWKKPIPKKIQTIGLKWLLRLINNPGHLGRVFNAVIIFPYKVYKSQI